MDSSILRIGKHVGSALVGLFGLLLALVGIRTECKTRKLAKASDPEVVETQEPKEV